MTETQDATSAHSHEPHHEGLGNRLNWLRAGVLGANDGIVSVAGIVVGVAGATTDRTAVLIAGIAGLVAGALSMAGGEYVSVSTQRDTERAMLRLEKEELATMPEAEEQELAEIYEDKGLSPELAAQVARELTEKDALQAHAEVELGIDPDELTSPWQAAGASLLSFSIGALLPLLAIALPPLSWRVWACVIAVVAGLFLTGYVSARLGNARARRAVLRNVGVGLLTMLVTYYVGALFDVAAH
ncbi:VIT family protein [Amycolatopsis acidiphila]|uniref:VIT family protein n=1 Tax=Amycolatopsis acidiphila TaxID=715473 RepID=A0A557ZQT9_9PSEU|nr:VIT family protein [Amycolatopsis acidiphila]TVT14394.1 VIT family protein [Amycolatopsis acidiphila]UIJ59488.1 VIT family protein [Amycolatopsis acidiphila]GHG80187.1 membrane protein [Amycolatopsis acidiphila]